MKRVLCLAAVAVGLVGSAFAGPKINFTGMGLSGTSAISGTGILPAGSYGPIAVNTGQMNFYYDANGNNNQDLPTDASFIGYCLTPNNVLQDPSDLAPGSPFVWDTLDGSRNSTYGGTVNSAWDGVARLFHNEWATQALNQNAAAAFQLAIWDLMSNPFSYGSLGGGLNSGAVATYYNQFMTTAANTGLVGKMILFKPLNFSAQSQMIGTHLGGGGGGFTPVPEPFTMGLGLAAAGAFVRRRVKAKKNA